MNFFFLLSFLLLFGCLKAQSYDIEKLKKQDNSLAKDYYIYRLLEENNLSKQEIQSLHSHIFRYVGKIKTEVEKIVKPKAYINPEFAPCYLYTKENILDANTTCQAIRLNSIAFISSLNTQTRNKLVKKFESKRTDLSNLLLAFNTTNPMAFIVEKEDIAGFLKLYKYFQLKDFELDAQFINKLSKSTAFKEFAQNIILKQESPKLRTSFLQIDSNSTKEETAFYLGVNALVYDREDLAYHFFKRAAHSLQNQNDKDNALFWQWFLKKDPKDLQSLTKSPSINIYTLYARELTNADFPQTINVKPSKEKSTFNMQDPFAWQKLAKDIQNADETKLQKLANEFNTQETLPIYTYILERLSKFKKHYFIMPYFEHIKNYDSARQALILAIARQESRFIPTAISTSYALGMMQFMPFLANHIGKNELKIAQFDQDFMFQPNIAYFFANHHLDYLESRLKSPLFIAYAYNGGIGFTNRMLARKDMFKEGKFEPFLSMELVPYRETRIYGKKVLANYIVYRHLLNDSIKISDIFESAIQNKVKN
ncbi:lytic transglycosylase domain-containing protein [Campylobacter sp. MIT 21-1685]|uniref:lytic transglycosylase domain-containing protein n=1 Tax=unclassified Campylobacter TaxID=2593542 RepID=UPI00224B4D94|nr:MULTISPECIES: lytic transglycosylase domain-containing protein [unclassified Campylobacter]MCX2682757.1 lytic transglycosylase domain-containing protein [Campylobacter sp. MIT 21-1684]MCX2751097.1 lytic transglycosylase domain-containing protein [Campylobacter sp. MIT 21-1682]MCX2807238.1 lytic transglycosylase domain-containing protein [Campylobacter sp. MIT 21-1685]